MSKGQLSVLWIAGIALCAVLVFVGLVQPYQAYKAKAGLNSLGGSLAKPFFEWVTDPPGSRIVRGASLAPTTIALPLPNYWVGAVAPIVILAACGFLCVTFAPKKKPATETAKAGTSTTPKEGD
jgi:hypothetical protein